MRQNDSMRHKYQCGIDFFFNNSNKLAKAASQNRVTCPNQTKWL